MSVQVAHHRLFIFGDWSRLASCSFNQFRQDVRRFYGMANVTLCGFNYSTIHLVAEHLKGLMYVLVLSMTVIFKYSIGEFVVFLDDPWKKLTESVWNVLLN